MITYGMAREFQ